MAKLPTFEELEARGELVVNHINHREYLLDGVRYVAGWNSKTSPTFPTPEWVIYEA